MSSRQHLSASHRSRDSRRVSLPSISRRFQTTSTVSKQSTQKLTSPSDASCILPEMSQHSKRSPTVQSKELSHKQEEVQLNKSSRKCSLKVQIPTVTNKSPPIVLPPPSRPSRSSYCSSAILNISNHTDRPTRQSRSSSQPSRFSSKSESTCKVKQSITVRSKKYSGISSSQIKSANETHPEQNKNIDIKSLNHPELCNTSENVQDVKPIISSLELVLVQNPAEMRNKDTKVLSLESKRCPTIRPTIRNPNNCLSGGSSDDLAIKSESNMLNNVTSSSIVLSSSISSSLSSLPLLETGNITDSSDEMLKCMASLPLTTSSSSSTIADNSKPSSLSSSSQNEITSSSSSGCISSSFTTLSSSSSIASLSSAPLYETQGGLQESSWAARAASIALRLTRVTPTVPINNPHLRRSVSPPPTYSAPHSPYFSHSRNSLSSQLNSTPPSLQQSNSHLSASLSRSTPSSPLLSHPRHSISLPIDSSLPYLPQQFPSPGHSRAPSPVMSRHLSPRRNSSPGHSLPVSPNLRPRSSHRSRSTRTPSPRPPLPPSTSNEPTAAPHPAGIAARHRTRPEVGVSTISKMRGR